MPPSDSSLPPIKTTSSTPELRPIPPSTFGVFGTSNASTAPSSSISPVRDIEYGKPPEEKQKMNDGVVPPHIMAELDKLQLEKGTIEYTLLETQAERDRVQAEKQKVEEMLASQKEILDKLGDEQLAALGFMRAGDSIVAIKPAQETESKPTPIVRSVLRPTHVEIVNKGEVVNQEIPEAANDPLYAQDTVANSITPIEAQEIQKDPTTIEVAANELAPHPENPTPALVIDNEPQITAREVSPVTNAPDFATVTSITNDLTSSLGDSLTTKEGVVDFLSFAFNKKTQAPIVKKDPIQTFTEQLTNNPEKQKKLSELFNSNLEGYIAPYFTELATADEKKAACIWIKNKTIGQILYGEDQKIGNISVGGKVYDVRADLSRFITELAEFAYSFGVNMPIRVLLPPEEAVPQEIKDRTIENFFTYIQDILRQRANDSQIKLAA